MSYYLFLDDERFPQDVTWVKLPPHNWTIVRNYADFVRTIENKGLPAEIAFDHDLGFEHYAALHTASKPGNGIIDYSSFKEKTGLECAKWLIVFCLEKNLPFPKFYVHSMNPIGKQNIISAVNSFKRYLQKWLAGTLKRVYHNLDEWELRRYETFFRLDRWTAAAVDAAGP